MNNNFIVEPGQAFYRVCYGDFGLDVYEFIYLGSFCDLHLYLDEPFDENNHEHVVYSLCENELKFCFASQNEAKDLLNKLISILLF